jgi:HTH-type transcriptional regulator, global nitrogen regulator NrpRI
MPDAETQRKLIEILRILSESNGEVGARKIAEELNRRGYNLGERATRYHLRMLDERGFTKKHGYLGRVITPMGEDEMKHALVTDRMGFVSTRIEDYEFKTTFDPLADTGEAVVNICYINKADCDRSLGILKRVVEAGYAISPRLKVVDEGQEILENDVPEGQVALATFCSITIDGVLLKRGIPVNLKYGGIVRVKNNKAERFTDIIDYRGTSINPMNVFVNRKMTSILKILETGSGNVLANVREIPINARERALKIIDELAKASVSGIFSGCERERPLLGVPVEMGMCGIASYSGINPFAALTEMGIRTRIIPLSAVMNVKELKRLD